MTETITNKELSRQLTELREMTLESQRAIRGTNGSDGVMQRLVRLETTITLDLSYLRKSIDILTANLKDHCDADRSAKSQSTTQPLPMSKADEDIVKFSWIFKSYIMPILLVITTFLITHFWLDKLVAK